MSDNLMDAINKRREARKKFEEKLIENESTYGEVLNRIFATQEGRYFAKYLIKFCRVFQCDSSVTPQQMLEYEGRRSVYLNIVRPYLDKDIIKSIENQ